MADTFPTSTHIAANLLQKGYKYRRPLGYYLAASAAYKTGKYIYDSMAPMFYRGRKRRSSSGYSPNKRRRMGSYKRRIAPKIRAGQGITQQYNRSSQYRYKRMPRYKKRAYRKKVQLVNHIINKSLGTQSVVFNEGSIVETVDSVNQAASTFLMYGANGTSNNSNTGMGDLNRIFQNIDSGDSPYKFRFESAILDITMTNVSTGDNDLSFSKLEVDVYEVMFRQETQAVNFSSAITLAQANTTNINPAGIGLNILNRGVTLFELPALGSFLSYKILKKTKYFIDYGQCITYQMKDNKNYSVDRMDIRESTGFVLEKMTKGIFVIHRLVPGNGPGARGRLAYGATRAYHYVHNLLSTTNDQFNP